MIRARLNPVRQALQCVEDLGVVVAGDMKTVWYISRRLIGLLLAVTWMPIPAARCQDGRSREIERRTGVHVDQADLGMVVSDSAPASRIGRDILRRGGSAVDAAVATALALAVSWPDAGNIGGGGFMLVRPADGLEPVCIDYRETAPGR